MHLVERYHQLIVVLQHKTGLVDKLMHVNLGLAIWLLAALALRVPLRSAKPILILALLEAANETMDRLHAGSWNRLDTRLDILATLFWLVVIAGALSIDKRLRR